MSNLCTMNDAMTRISFIAKLLPAHILGPEENGINALVFRITSGLRGLSNPSNGTRSSDESQRSGQKVFGNGEKYRESRWRLYV